jgi:RNA polymerase sigma factor (sigma-70 family)
MGPNKGRPPGAVAPDDAFEEFFRAVFPRAVAIARRVTGEVTSAEDAAIEAMAKAHVRWRTLRHDDRRASWVLKVATNEAIERLPRAVASHATGHDDDFSDQIVLRQTLSAALHRLPSRQREALVLRFLVGLPENEVATTLQLSLGTVKTHIRRGLARLRTDIGTTLREDFRAQLA